ncbi:ArsR/SmtB family transcription factor [Pseudonocardia acaciae]|uniref:ArsR/SmtB family transcription factor n=1 Tax=Pseudonocardia acaciae TaxID=551276 RepID=UPI000686717B|nr:metalloregulator ArsR/SmtB family transcription factor [Pseudonocardia acaciae]
MTRELDVALLDVTSDASVLDQARQLAACLKALGDENRLLLLVLLAERPRSVRELTEATGMSQTLVSHHLAPLRQQGLVSVTPRGRSNIYDLCCQALAAPVQLLASLAALTPEGATACCTPARAQPAGRGVSG